MLSHHTNSLYLTWIPFMLYSLLFTFQNQTNTLSILMLFHTCLLNCVKLVSNNSITVSRLLLSRLIISKNNFIYNAGKWKQTLKFNQYMSNVNTTQTWIYYYNFIFILINIRIKTLQNRKLIIRADTVQHQNFSKTVDICHNKLSNIRYNSSCKCSDPTWQPLCLHIFITVTVYPI